MKVKIYSDGSSRGNPGPGGYGSILKYVDPNGQLHVKELTEGFKETTNNKMELLGVIVAFECLKKPCDVEVYSDSKYVIDAFRQKWIDSWVEANFRRGKKNEVKNIELWERLLKAIEPHNVTWNWIKGHNGHPENERCDELATKSADSI